MVSPPGLLEEINLLDPRFYTTGEQHRVWAQLREEQPVYWQALDAGPAPGFWVLTKYEDVRRVLRDHRTFTSEHGNLLTTLGRRDAAGGKMLAVTDPPRHSRLKAQIAGALTPSAVARFEPRLRLLARQVIAPAATGAEWDFAAAAAVYPIAFTALLMGIDAEDWDRLRRFAYVAIADQDPEYAEGCASTGFSALDRAHAEIFAYFARAVPRVADDGRGGLLAQLVSAQVEGETLSRDEILFNAYSLLLGATVTTSHAATVGLHELIRHPDQYDRWTAAGALDTCVDEVLRWSSPATHFVRHATTAVRIRDTEIAEADPVTVWLGAANRDEEVFGPDAGTFDVLRHPNPHIAFGAGAHRCVGAPLAKLALRILMGEIGAMLERVEAAGEAEPLCSNFIAGIKRLPIRTTPRPGAAERLAAVTPFEGGRP